MHKLLIGVANYIVVGLVTRRIALIHLRLDTTSLADLIPGGLACHWHDRAHLLLSRLLLLIDLLDLVPHGSLVLGAKDGPVHIVLPLLFRSLAID